MDEKLEDLKEGEFREQENPQNQIQINTERQRTMAHDNLQIVSDSRMHDPRRHDTELRLEREKMVNRELEKQRIEPLIGPLVRRYMQAKRDKEVEQRERASIESQRIVAQENLRQQRLQGMRENQNVDAHDQEKTQELGFKGKEGDGV